MNLDNTKVGEDLSISAVLKFPDFRPLGLGDIDFLIFAVRFDCVLYSSGLLCISTMLTSKLASVDN